MKIDLKQGMMMGFLVFLGKSPLPENTNVPCYAVPDGTDTVDAVLKLEVKTSSDICFWT